MNHCKHVAAVAILFLTTSVAAFGQMNMRQTQLPRGIFHPVVGNGAVYEMTDTSMPKRIVEFDIVGKDTVNGKDAYWVEFNFPDTGMGDIIAKTQAILDGGTTYTARTIMQMGNRPPMEMPASMGAKPQPQPIEIKDKADDLGSELVTTPAGTFTCEHYRMKDGTGDAWVSASVSPFGLVKSQSKDSTMVLVKTLTGVTDKITGTPVPFNPMMMMQRPPQ